MTKKSKIWQLRKTRSRSLEVIKTMKDMSLEPIACRANTKLILRKTQTVKANLGLTQRVEWKASEAS